MVYYDVTVYDIETGNLVKQLWGIDDDELEEIQYQYGNNDKYDIIIEPNV